MKNKAFVLLAGLTTLSLQAQADSYQLSNLAATPLTGRSLKATPTLTPSDTPETADSVPSESPHTVESVIDRPATSTTPGRNKITTTFTRTITSYAPSTAATETYQALIQSPAVTGAVQRLRLTGQIKSLVHQTMTFQMIANGAYTNRFDSEGDPIAPLHPAIKYKFASLAFSGITGGINLEDTNFKSKTGNVDPDHFTNYNETTGLLALNFNAGETKYFAAQVATDSLASITDFLISFTGAPEMGKATTKNVDVVEITYTPIAPTVPEPETYSLLLAGLAVMGFMARRSKQSEA